MQKQIIIQSDFVHVPCMDGNFYSFCIDVFCAFLYVCTFIRTNVMKSTEATQSKVYRYYSTNSE